MAGRPSYKVEVSLTNPLKSLQQIRKCCEKNEKIRLNVKTFAELLISLTVITDSKSTQTDNDETSLIQNICELSENFTSYEKSFLV